MLKWAIAKEDRRDGGAALHPGGHCRSLSTSSSAQSSPSIEAVANCKGSLLTLRKRRKLSHNGAHSADELETPGSGNNTRARTTSGGTNLNQMTSSNSMTISCGVLSNHNQNHNLPGGINSSNNNNKDLNADSKSLLYMSLDHLPLAIVKQYERMLQEDEAENCHGKLGPQPGSNGPNGESQVRKVAMASGRDDSKLETKGASMKTPKKSSMPTLPTRFKAKGGKKVILPLHNSPGISAKTVEAGNASLDVSSSTVGSVNSNSCGTKGLSSLSKFVKHGKGSKKKCKKRTPPPGSQQPGDKDASIVAQDDKAGAVGAVTTTKAASAAALPPRCTPSPTSMSVGSGCGNEQIRHARSRSLRTSFKSSNASLNVGAGSTQGENSRPGSSTSARRTKTNSQSTQTLQVKSILKNPLEPNKTCADGTKNQVELNNNHAGVANQNSVEVTSESGSSANAPPSPTASSSSRTSGTKSDPDSPAQADLSTLVHPPTPAALMKTQGAVSGGKSGVASNTIPSNLATKGAIITSGKKYEDDHDTTDPQFLETSLAYSFPVVTRRAKKLTLKRSELRKLERIRSQTDRLNRFLRKYYHECLPNLPEEEDSNCSPEEKSLAILRNYLGDDNPRFRGHGSRKNLADLLNEAAFSGIVTNSSSSLSSSGSSSSCSSSSSSDYTDWVTSTGTLRPNHHHHSRSHSRRLSQGTGGGASGSHHHRRHRSRKLSQISGLYSAGRNILSPSNESALLPSIQEDSAEVSSASVKSTDSVKRSPRRNALRNNNSHSDRLAVKQGDLEVRNCEGAGMRIIHEDELKNRLGPDKEYLHGTFVTEGTKTDLEKLKGEEQSEQSFDHMPPTGSREECRDEMMNPLHQNHQIRISKEQVLQARLQSQHSQQDSQHLEEKPGEHAPVPQSTSSCQYYENLDCFQAQSQLQFPVQDEEDDHLYENDPRLFEQYENTRQFHADYERRLRLHDDYENHGTGPGFPDYENAEDLSHTYANETWNSHRCHTPELFPECGDTGSIGSAGSSSSHGYGSGRSDPTTPTVIILQVEDDGNLVDGNEHHPSHVHHHHPPDLKVRAGEKEYESPREISFTPVRNETRTPPSIQGAHHQPTSNSCRTIPLSANNTGSNANYAEHETVDWNSHESPPVSPLVSSQSVIIMTEEDSGTGGFKSQVSQPSNKRNVKCVRFSRSPSVSPPPLLVEPLKSSDHQVINNNCNLNPFWKPVRGVEQHSRHDNTDPHQPRSDIDLLQQHENTHFSFQPEPLAPVNKNAGGTRKLSGIDEENEQDPADEQDYEDEDEYENDDDDDEDEKHSSFSSDQETGECSFEATYRPANVRLMVPKLTITAPPKSPACPRASAGTTPRSLRPLSRTPLAKKSTPRKLVRKPPVKTLYTGKGEVFVRSYTNGGYVTLHVLHAKNLPTSYRSSWKLAIKNIHMRRTGMGLNRGCEPRFRTGAIQPSKNIESLLTHV